jgi:hypothetical protein
MVLELAAVITIVVASVFTMGRVSGMFGFFGVGVAIRHLDQLTSGGGPLAMELAVELLVLEPLSESSDGFSIGNVWDGISCFRETPDKIAQRFPKGLVKFFQVILGAGLLVRGHVVVGENLFEVIPR